MITRWRDHGLSIWQFCMSANKGIRSKRRVEINAQLSVLEDITSKKPISIQELYTHVTKNLGWKIEMYALRNLLCKNTHLFRCFKRSGVYHWKKVEKTKKQSTKAGVSGGYRIADDIPDELKVKYGFLPSSMKKANG